MYQFNDFPYVLTIVCGLSRFAQRIPCSKNIRGEQVFKKIFEHCICKYGKPTEIISDNDVRFTSMKGFYKKASDSLDIKVIFTPPHHPQSNGLCERTNRSFIQNIRFLSKQLKTVDWPSLTPLATVIHNSQISVKTGFSPSDLFLARSLS